MILILGLVAYANAGFSAYGPVYTPVIKAVSFTREL